MIKWKHYLSTAKSAAIKIQRKVREVKQKKKSSKLLNMAMEHLNTRKKFKYMHEKLNSRIRNDIETFELDMGDVIDMRE